MAAVSPTSSSSSISPSETAASSVTSSPMMTTASSETSSVAATASISSSSTTSISSAATSAMIVVNCYAVVIYFIYEFHSPTSSTIHFLNCLFVVFHTLGILIFLNNSQQLQNKVKGLIPILLEYFTRLNTSEEHQQIRLFVEKLKQHRPLNASGVVNIDLSIAGSICANILTYVLVALQFDVPKG